MDEYLLKYANSPEVKIRLDDTSTIASIKVIGVGGAGNNVVDELIKSNMEGVEFIAVNTDSQALETSLAHIKVQIGDSLCRGLGTGGDPERGKQAAIEDKEKIIEILEGANLVWITAGMGGGTGTGACPIIAEAAKELNILTVAVVTTPFAFESGQRMRQAMQGIDDLRTKVDSYIVVPNEKLLKISDKSTTLKESFGQSNEVLKQAVKGVSELILKKGLVNRDLTDVQAVLQNKGRALMGTGIGKGENRAIQAIENAIASPLLEDVSIEGSTAALIIVFSDQNLGMQEIHSAISIVRQKLHQDANIYWGAYEDESLGEGIKFTVIISGLPENLKQMEATKSVTTAIAAEQTVKTESVNFYRGKTPTPSTLEDLYDVKFDGEEAEFMIPAYKRKLKDLKT